MELFNKYKNKNFAFLTNYINNCIGNNKLALSPEQLHSLLSGASQSTFEEFLLALTNQISDNDQYNAALLYNKNNAMLPIRQVSIPIRTTLAEKSWLLHILQDQKADLFLDQNFKNTLIHTLSTDFKANDYSINSQYIDIRELSSENVLKLSAKYISNFKSIVKAIRYKKYIKVTNNAFSGKTYSLQKVFPYKLEYSSQFDSFSLSCYPLDTKRPVKMYLNNIMEVIIADNIENYNAILQKFETQLKQTKELEPVTIEILNQAEAYDRCAYLFSSYNTYCQDIGEEKLRMTIYYYRFQQKEIVRNILFLGHYVKVLSPQNIVDEVISEIKESYNNYN